MEGLGSLEGSICKQIIRRLKRTLVLGRQRGGTVCDVVGGSSPLSGPFGLSRGASQPACPPGPGEEHPRKCSSRRASRAAARRPRRRGDFISRMPPGRGAEGRRGVGPRAEPGVGARRPRRPRLWASVRVVWFGPCSREDDAAARVQTRPGPPRTMGSILSRRIAGVEDIDIQANSAYRYPPKSGERPAPALPRPQARPRGPSGRVGALLGPELRAHSTRTPGRGWGAGLAALARPGDLGSVTSLLRASAPSSAHGDNS